MGFGVFDKFLRIELKSRDHKVTTYNPREEIYMLKSPICVDGTVCRENGTRADTYVLDIYSRETYKRTYQSKFHPVGHENFVRDAPYNLTFHPPNMNNERGRKHGTRFRGKWIIEIWILPQDVADIAYRDIIEKML
ncbi:hypothetical protein M9H77_04413 [Catharanthus roseus]|uniref:Uncharacterized protein n=1 Tax=Catharanthus roseus TaxID=4058 RepID=A0ACC0CE70_CATRO|nr:hypothetical protein M9H77_04413 [Catharanthus roseus]